MGKLLLDQYSLLHFAVGIVVYFWGISLKTWIIGHILFEYIENTPRGMQFINNNLNGLWPGGKPEPDSFINSTIGDNLIAALGWLFAYYIDNLGKKYNLYTPHINKN